MPSVEETYAARDEVSKRMMEKLEKEGHPKSSARMIAELMTHEQKCEKLGIQTGRPYSVY